MFKLNIKTTITFLVVSGIIVWFVDAGLHTIMYPHNSFFDAAFDTSVHELYIRVSFWLIITLLFLVVVKNRIINDQNSQIENIFNNVIPICITNLDYEIVKANNPYWAIWERTGEGPIKCYDHRPGNACHTENCALTQTMNAVKKFACESKKGSDEKAHHYIVTATPMLDSKKRMTGIIESFQDITERKKLEDEKAKLIEQLQSSLEKVKLLSGLIPICASCKKIRDDKGYWNQIESYIRNHSEAEFSHGICPECAHKLYPDLFKRK